MFAALDDIRRAKRARVDAVDTMAADVQTTYRYMHRNISSATNNAEAMTSKVASEVRTLNLPYRVLALTLSTGQRFVERY